MRRIGDRPVGSRPQSGDRGMSLIRQFCEVRAAHELNWREPPPIPQNARSAFCGTFMNMRCLPQR